MEMKVNSQLIKSQREKKGWTQEHLAIVAGLGHRTVHRIENNGTASFESVMALASALAMQVEDLQLDETNAELVPTMKNHSMTLELSVRLGLAILSGIFVSYLMYWSDFQTGFAEFSLGGALFGVAVLCPYLNTEKPWFLRSIGLITAGALSFYGATRFLSFLWDNGLDDSLVSFSLASLAGAAIVLIALRSLVPLKINSAYWLVAIVASLLGGATMFFTVRVISDYEFASLSSVTGFCIWHSIICLVTFFGRSKDNLGNFPGSVLADFLSWATQKLKSSRKKAIKLNKSWSISIPALVKFERPALAENRYC